MTEPVDTKIEAEIIRSNTEIWKQAVSVQMHFNDLCIRTRWLGLTVITTILGASLFSLERATLKIKIFLTDRSFYFDGSTIFVLFSLSVWFSVKELDKKYYYRMLIASVEWGTEFYSTFIPDRNAFGVSLNYYITQKVPRERAVKTMTRFYHWSLWSILLVLILTILVPNVRLQ